MNKEKMQQAVDNCLATMSQSIQINGDRITSKELQETMSIIATLNALYIQGCLDATIEIIAEQKRVK